MGSNVNKKKMLAAVLFILIILAVVCAVVLGGGDKLTSEKAETKLLERLAGEPIIGRADIEIKNPAEQEININDGQEARSEKVYTFEFRYNEKSAGVEGRLLDIYAVSQDGKKVYWYDPAKDWYMDYDSKPTYYEARAKLLELMADHPDIDKMDIWDVENVADIGEIVTSPSTDVIEIFDGKDIRTESVYNFSFYYNENMPGLEERLAGDYAISLDGEHIYYYDQAEDYHIEYKLK